MYKPAKLDFTDAQIKKLIKGQPVRLSASQVGSGNKVVMLHPANYANAKKSAMKGKGLTISLSPGEILSTVESDMEGTGFFGDLWKGLKSGYNWVKRNIIDTPLYQSTIKPLVRGAVDKGAAMLGAYTGNPQLVNQAKDLIGKETGAFGMAKPVMRRSRVKGGSFKLN